MILLDDFMALIDIVKVTSVAVIIATTTDVFENARLYFLHVFPFWSL